MSTDHADTFAAAASPEPVDLAKHAGKEPDTRFTDVAAWVQQWLAPSLSMHVQGDGRGTVFCPQWWDHDPVVVRLTALWEAWEKASAAKTQSTWWVQHADPHLKALCDGETGPMRRCGEHRHVPTRSLHTIPAPAGWLDQLTNRGPNFAAAARVSAG